MRFTPLYLGVCSLLLVASARSAEPPKKPQPSPSPQAIEFFETRVRPLLVQHCLSCHGSEKQKSGLRLDSRAALLRGSDAGPVILPQVDKSPFLKAIRYDGDLRMPPRAKLPAEAIEVLSAWVKMGTPWPENAVDPKTQPKTVTEVRKSHWAFQPVRRPTPPAVKDLSWAQADIDRFILAGLEKKGLAPSAPADRRTVLRRLSFDLIGLPPTPEEIAAFEADKSPDAYVKQVDRLLASPHYGERWGRHWLDIARYADTKGYIFTQERRFPYAYTYRDYVIDAFNRDLPYDQFIRQQLAADQLPLGEDKRPLAAMGFLTLGRRFLGNVHDIIDDRMDVTMRGLQGLTIGCARCHDHKYDPIPMKDYYSLYGVFASSVEPADLPQIASPMPTPAGESYKKELAKLQKDVEDFKAKHQAELDARNRKFRNQLTELQKKVDRLKATHPGAPASAMVLVDAPHPTQPYVFLRGNPNNHGPTVPRQFVEVIAGEGRKPFSKGSGRLELAEMIASKDNPLTARVMVNRIWQHHFGQGLVRTPSDFGVRGEPPTHPELLDYLAASFMEDGWSIKKLHRQILLSRVYQQGSEDNTRGQQVDPDNRLLWKMNRQRLEFEPLRDSLLFVAGRLDLAQGGPAVEITTAPFATRRAIYGFIERQNLPGVFRTFDFASPDTSTAQRHHTTVPQQALFLMNSPFVVEQAKALAERPDVMKCGSPAAKIERLYQICYGRNPEAEEVALGERFLAVAQKQAATEGKNGARALTPWQQYVQVLVLANEFSYVD